MVVNCYNQLKSENEEIKYRNLMKRNSNTVSTGLNTVQTTVSEYNQSKTVTLPKRKKIELVL